MTVRYVMGRACKGKSHYILNEIRKNLQRNNGEKLFLIVPEQFTLQAERDLIEKLGLPGIMDVEVLSFTRLAERVFAEAGGLNRVLLNNQGKNMILKKIIDDHAHQLCLYQKAAKQEGFITRFSDLITELKQNEVTSEKLRELISQSEDEAILSRKLNDIAIIYEQFTEYLKGRYIDTEDFVNLFIDKIKVAHLLNNSLVWIDGFTTFSSQSLKIIEEIMLKARETVISFTMDFSGQERDRDLFVLSRRSYNRIHDLAVSNNLKEEIIRVDSSTADSFKKQEILHLESELYAYPYQVYKDSIENIEVFAASNIYMEVEQVAARIISMVRNQGCRWKDIAVICNDLDVYGSLIKRVFHEYQIPWFMDEKRDIMDNPIIILVLSLLDITQRGYRYEDVFRFIKTGFSDLEIDASELLENYVLKYGIRGNRWEKEFTFGDKEENLEQLNEWRLTVSQRLIELEGALQGKKTYAQITKVLFEILEQMNIPDKIAAKVNQLRDSNYYALASENARIWNIVIEIFDQVFEILGDQEVSLKEYRRVLEAGFQSYELGIIPTTIDEVFIGNIQRSKSQDIKALFVMGVNDGVLPSNKEADGILTGEEKELLQGQGMELGLNREMKSLEEKFLIYSAITKPAEFLWFSFPLADEEGRALRPSLIIERLKRIFSQLQIKTDILNDRQTQLQTVSTPESTFKYLVENLRQELDGSSMEPFWWDVYSWYYSEENWQKTLASTVKGFFHQNQESYINQNKVRHLYKLPLRTSISRLEQFVACPFAHFIRYGLRPQERKMYIVEAPDIGSIFHDAIADFASNLDDNNIDWFTLEKDACVTLIDKVMDKQLAEYGSEILTSTYRYKYMVTRLKRISRRAVWTLTEHLQSGKFTPLGHEIRFGEGGILPAIEVELEEGEKLYLEGRIDRVDILEDDSSLYVKIIDYKSGDKKLKLSDIYYGLALQLLIYLKAVLYSKSIRENQLVKPAGILYFKIDDPMVNSEEKIVANIEEQIAKELKMKGLLLKDVKVVRDMDRDIQGYSSIIPIGLNKDDKFYSNSSVIEEEDFLALIRHVENLVKEIGEEIIKGKITIEPVKTEQYEQCQYCKYRAICQFDQLFASNNFRHIRTVKDEAVISKIQNGNTK
ncbi:MAG: helicase-exonuclease AddAB subunit AddB [Syntrophomonadaceae bacterium]|nr:helicase-exonuclease AddAB subunit AddB [Syntrophomonadaceae bacterium]